jgi:hypothetical protein
MLVSSIINASLRKLGVVASGETPETQESADGLAALQSMLRSWSALRINTFASVKETFSTVAGTSYYTWGTGGTINTARPHQIIGAVIRDSAGVDHVVDLISEGKYRSISVKATDGRPYGLFFQPAYPLAGVYLYPTPNEAEVIYIDSFKAFTETSSFDSIASTLAFPSEYEEAIIYNLARRLASEFGKSMSSDDLKIAEDSKNIVDVLNASNQIEPVSIVVPAGYPGGIRYSINTDSYH